MELYCQKSGKKYKNYRAALQDFIRRDLDRGKLRVVVAPKDTISEVISSYKGNPKDSARPNIEEELKEQQKKIEEAKAKIREKFVWMNSHKS